MTNTININGTKFTVRKVYTNYTGMGKIGYATLNGPRNGRYDIQFFENATYRASYIGGRTNRIFSEGSLSDVQIAA